MKLRLLLPLAFVVTAVLWSVVTWPLPARVGDAIPCTSQNIQGHPPRAMVAGDQLQLLYRFWLLEDTLTGNSPFARNVYEFNRGDDDERRLPGAYYLPFSLLHIVTAAMFGPAFAWNLTGFVSLWLTYVFTVLVLRFYTRDDLIAFVFAGLAILSPYRYWALLSGSPTGFAMLWPPVVVFGLELALRKGRTMGGVTAGAGLLLCCISDVQLFLFTFLLAVTWGGGLFVWRWVTEKRALRASVVEGLRALWPTAVALVICYAYSRHLSHMIGSSEHMSGGRTMSEVANFSPSVRMLFSTDMSLDTQGMYVGYSWMALAVFGMCSAIYAALKRKGLWRSVAISAAWMAALVMLYSLALGTNGPGEGMFLVFARKLVSPLRMVRNPSRFATVAPTLIAIMLCVVAAPVLARMKRRTAVTVLCLFSIVVSFEYGRCTNIGLTMPDRHQGAYAAIGEDHALQSDTPVRAVALPLWPGDTHWSSIYQYHASLHRVRMLNGYSPVVEREYYEQVFQRFRSMNAGVIDDAQLDSLLAMDIRYILFYEDAFPEKVSPFPAAHTLSRLGAHPRLAFIKRDRRVWAFRILAEPDPEFARAMLESPVQFPARFYDVQHTRKNAAARIQDPSAEGGAVVLLNEEHQKAHVGRTSALGGSEPVWFVRIRGHGSFGVSMQGESLDWRSDECSVADDAWRWVAVSTEGMPPYAVGVVTVDWLDGQLEVDCICLTTLHEPMGSCELAAASFFRAGEADDKDGSVLFDPERDVPGRIFYGPRLPFKPGSYRLVLDYESDAPEGALLGSWAIEKPAARSAEVLGGASQATLVFDQTGNPPVELSFTFAANHTIILRSVRIEHSPVGTEEEREQEGSLR